MSAVICLRGATWRLYPCILWAGCTHESGYGWRYVRGSKPKRYIAVHRTALEQKLSRPIREGYLACHHCDVRNCYQPEHLYEGTQSDNARDMYDRGRGMPAGKPQVTDATKAEIRARVAAGAFQRDVAVEFGLHHTTVCTIVATGRGRAVVTDSIRQEIRRRYASGGVTQGELAREFGLGSGTVGRAVAGVKHSLDATVRSRYAEGGVTKAQVAREFGVSWMAVDRIVRSDRGT